jgi:hypothetical protein
MTFIKAGTKTVPLQRVVMKQLSREDYLIGNGRKNAQGVVRHILTHVLTEWRGGNPTTMLLDVRVINVGLAINWSNMIYWRHVVLTGLRRVCTLRPSAISQWQCGPTMQSDTQRVNGFSKTSSLAGRYAEKSLRDVRIMDGASC